MGATRPGGACRRRRVERAETRRAPPLASTTNTATRTMTRVRTMTGRDYRRPARGWADRPACQPIGAGSAPPGLGLSSLWLTTTEEPPGAMLTP